LKRSLTDHSVRAGFAALFARAAGHERDVFLADLPGLELAGQLAEGVPGERDEQQPRGVAVEAMHDPGAREGIARAQVVEQRALERERVVVPLVLDGHAGRLVADQQVPLLAQDREPLEARGRDPGQALGEQVEPVAGGEDGPHAAGEPVPEDALELDQSPQVGGRDVREHVRQDAQDGQPRMALVEDQLFH